MHTSLGRCGRSHIRVGRSSQRITLPFAILTMEAPTEVALVTTRHDIFDTEAMWKCMEEGGVMWCEVVAAARAAGTSVVEHQSSIAEKRLERARQRLDEIGLEKVTRRWPLLQSQQTSGTAWSAWGSCLHRLATPWKFRGALRLGLSGRGEGAPSGATRAHGLWPDPWLVCCPPLGGWRQLATTPVPVPMRKAYPRRCREALGDMEGLKAY